MKTICIEIVVTRDAQASPMAVGDRVSVALVSKSLVLFTTHCHKVLCDTQGEGTRETGLHATGTTYPNRKKWSTSQIVKRGGFRFHALKCG